MVRTAGTCVGLVTAAMWLAFEAPASDATFTIEAKTRRQTIRGWSANPYFPGLSDRQRLAVIDDAVNMLGITRLRWQQPNGNRFAMRRWEWENDNGDPDETDLSKLNTAFVDKFVAWYILPFKRRVEANGDPFELWLSPSFFDGGSTGPVPAWLLHSPGEYAEHAISFMRYIRDRHGIDTTHYAICNEAGNHNAFNPAVVAEMTKVLGPRMRAAGLSTRGQFPDSINAKVAWRYIQHVMDDPEFWPHVQLLTYHWYGRDNQQFMAKIRDVALAKGLETGQTEFMHLTMSHLCDDLTVGRASYWSIYGLGGPSPRGQNYYFHRNGTSFSRGRQFWHFRQVMHYVRPGAVRIAGRSSDPTLRALAFERSGRATAVLINQGSASRPRRVTLAGLPAGRYGVSHSLAKSYRELGVQTVAADGRLAVDVPRSAVLTIYPHPGGNMPPTVTHWAANPDHLKASASRTSLSASAQDSELDPLQYSWAVSSAPNGATVSLAAPDAAITQARGLTRPGQYVFAVTVSDGTSRVRREVVVNVFGGNQPPILIDVHNRIPVVVTLPQSTTHLRGGAFDLEGDTLAFQWSVNRQPHGSQVQLDTPTQGKCKVSNISLPGDHVFQFVVNDGTHSVSQELTVPVYPVNAAPAIARAAVSPARLVLPASAATLTAATSDPDGDVVTHWWSVRRAPAGARVAFTKQGGPVTRVTGVTVPGYYAFRLTAVDRTKVATKDVTLAARPESGAADPGYSDPPAERSKGHRTVASGRTLGTVVGQGGRWVDLKSDSGTVVRYIPHWVGGAPKDGGGPEKRTLKAIAQLRPGDRVVLSWSVDRHVRIEEIRPAP